MITERPVKCAQMAASNMKINSKFAEWQHFENSIPILDLKKSCAITKAGKTCCHNKTSKANVEFKESLVYFMTETGLQLNVSYASYNWTQSTWIY